MATIPPLSKLKSAFAQFLNVGAFRNEIPATKEEVSKPNFASYDIGFPPKTFDPVNNSETTGIPPTGADFNGVLFDLSTHVYRQQMGCPTNTWDSQIATQGYPLNAIVWYNNLQYISLINDNTQTPPTASAWRLLYTQNTMGIPNWSASYGMESPNYTFPINCWFSLVYQATYYDRLYLNGAVVGWAYARRDDYGSVMCSVIPVRAGDVLSGNGNMNGSRIVPFL